MLDRTIRWEGFHNARDLGGLPTRSGATTRFGQLIRSAHPRLVTAEGWREAHAAGVRTIIDLRSDREADRDVPVTGNGLQRLRVSLDPWDDEAFYEEMKRQRKLGTPLYFAPLLARKPRNIATVVTALVRTEPGAVVFHCAAGRDRTGVLAVVLLAFAGVNATEIADDYDLSHASLRLMFPLIGRDVADLDELAQAMLHHGVSTREVMAELLAGFDAERYLLDAGVTPGDLITLRARLLA